MGVLNPSLSVLALLLSAFLYYRRGILSTFYANAPGRLVHVNELKEYEIRFKDDLRNCEDVYVNDKAGFALISCDPGRDEWNTVMGTFVNSVQPPETGIYLYNYADAPDEKPKKITLQPSDQSGPEYHPLGIEYDTGSRTLFVANHVSSGPKVDIYDLNVEEVTATFKGFLKDSQIAAPNSIFAVSDSELFITNDHYFPARDHPVLSKIETYAGLPLGSVVHVNLSSTGETQFTTLARLPFANGVTLLNSTTLAVSSSTGTAVRLYTVDRSSSVNGAPTLALAARIPLPFIPDNLSLDGNGKLLVAGHPHAPSVEKVSKQNRFCQQDRIEDSDLCNSLHRLSYIAEWSEQDGLSILYAGEEFGTSTTAARDVSRGFGFASGLYDRGLLTWKL